jgi:hypothetical protein
MSQVVNYLPVFRQHFFIHLTCMLHAHPIIFFLVLRLSVMKLFIMHFNSASCYFRPFGFKFFSSNILNLQVAPKCGTTDGVSTQVCQNMLNIPTVQKLLSDCDLHKVKSFTQILLYSMSSLTPATRRSS